MPFSCSFPLWQQKNATFTQKWVDTVFSIIQPSLSSLPPVRPTRDCGTARDRRDNGRVFMRVYNGKYPPLRSAELRLSSALSHFHSPTTARRIFQHDTLVTVLLQASCAVGAIIVAIIDIRRSSARLNHRHALLHVLDLFACVIQEQRSSIVYLAKAVVLNRNRRAGRPTAAAARLALCSSCRY
jgi:hypothetical protein